MIKNRIKQWKKKWLSHVIAYGGKFAIRLILKTCKISVNGLNNLTSSLKTHPSILMLWHKNLIIISEILDKYTSDVNFSAFISKSRDGESLAILANSYKRGKILRVPHNTRHIALNKMIDTLKNSSDVVIVTPDGPKGPKEVVKPGIAHAARTASALIIPFSWEASRYWTLRTWDKMKIPKPFSKIHAKFGKAIDLSSNINQEQLPETEILTAALKTLEETLVF